MTKERQDAWSEEDDLLLAETVLRHVREGSTQLTAFEEVGDHLDRTSAAVGFRWNAIVRRRYEQALKIAKRQRKERNRAMQKASSGREVPSALYNELNENYQTTPVEQESTNHQTYPSPYTGIDFKPKETKRVESTSVTTHSNSITMDQVIQFLKQFKESSIESGALKKENHRLQEDYNNLLRKSNQLQEELSELNEKYENVKEDYQAMLQIMDRARRMILLQEDDASAATKFKMDKNGNLEKIAK
jgi:prespore-specific regulator